MFADVWSGSFAITHLATHQKIADTYTMDTSAMPRTSTPIRIPPIDRRTKEFRDAAQTRDELQKLLGPTPSFHARQLAEEIVRTELDISLLQRQRHELGPLSRSSHDLLIKREQLLAELLERLERVAPATDQPHHEQELATA
jgi:uncharacterized membrane protein YccC